MAAEKVPTPKKKWHSVVRVLVYIALAAFMTALVLVKLYSGDRFQPSPELKALLQGQI